VSGSQARQSRKNSLKKDSCALRLPYRASKVFPDEVLAMLPGNPVPLLIHETVLDGKKAENGDVAE
jgi:hypothetical protein